MALAAPPVALALALVVLGLALLALLPALALAGPPVVPALLVLLVTAPVVVVVGALTRAHAALHARRPRRRRRAGLAPLFPRLLLALTLQTRGALLMLCRCGIARWCLCGLCAMFRARASRCGPRRAGAS